MERLVTPPSRGTSPTWGPPPPCEQALIDGVINFAEAENISGLLLFLDFEKAFDTVEWVFIKKTFQQFNFGP